MLLKNIFSAFFITLILPIYAQPLDTISLEDLFLKNTYQPVTISGFRSMNDGEFYTLLNNENQIVKYSYATGLQEDIVFSANESTIPPSFQDYELSANENKILLTTAKEGIYRRSFKANFIVYDRKSKKHQSLSTNGKQQLATFSPDGSKVTFVRDNNLFVVDLVAQTENQITFDGKYNHIINGAPDWVYEEEFGFSKGFHWSPNGDKIAFYRFDESSVKLFNMTMYQNHLYTQNYTFKYPKAGEDNSVVQIMVFDLNTKKTTVINIGDETNQYIPGLKWTNDNNLLSIVRLNRLQNHIEILLANAASGESNIVYSETNPLYISEIDETYPTFINEKNDFIINSEKSGYNHLYLYECSGKPIRQLTKGNWDVVSLKGYHSKNSQVYYTSHEISPLQTDLYQVSLKGKSKKKLSTHAGSNDIIFSRGFNYYLNYYSSTSSAPVVTLHQSNGKLVRTLVNNQKLNEKVSDTGIEGRSFFTITTSEGVDLNAWMIKPFHFDENKKYPVLMFVYGGPGSQTVTDSWSFGWYEYLAQKGFVIVSVDNRGTGGRGEAFKKLTYGQLGKFETIDQIESALYLTSLPYIDGNKIAIFGWSYGGYMSTLCITKGADVFALAIAVAPVTNWRFYDSVYTERYMGLPQNNANGYDDNSPINYVEKLKGKYLLVHGTGDDNVHLQNSIELVDRLVQQNKQFQQFFYPDKNHSINGGNTRLHLYTMLSNYLIDNLLN